MLHYITIQWHAVAQFVKALPYKPEGRGFDSREGNWDF
jgi:hypothetical protein